MQQILNVWNALELRRKVIVILATVAVFAGVTGIARMAAQPSLTLLYSGLENGAAGEVVRALEQRGVAYEVRGGAIFVEAGQRDALRMTLASEGLPANSAKGYELLDGLSGFGTTSQMFDAAYWRAKEGELARTILAGPGITSARVHIANAGGNPFRRDLRPSASVSVTTSGGALPPAQARALRYLVAAAVAGMQSEDVTVIDGTGAIVAGDEAPANTTEDRGAALREKVQRLLEARVGQDNAVVELTLETVTESESIRERRFDPSGRVAISTETEESNDSSQNAGGDEVTVASNLPDGDAGGGGNSSNSQNNRVRERVNYEVSETEREVLRAAGAIKRLSVAVLVNGVTTTDAEGNAAFAPRPDEELGALRDLVASAVGFDQDRGDVITLKSMAFEPVTPMGTVAVPGLFDRFALDAMSLIQLAVLAVVTLLLGMFVVRPLLSGGSVQPTVSLPPPASSGEPQESGRALTGEIADEDGNFAELAPSRGAALAPTSPEAQTDAVGRLRALINERQDETVEILRSWLEDEEEPAR